MNRLLSVLLVATAASRFLALGPSTPAAAPPAPVDLRIEIAPTSYGPYELLRERRDTYTCTATLVDEARRPIPIRGEVIMHPGQEQTNTASWHGLQMTLKGRIDSGRTTAVADVTVTRDGALIAHQQSRVTLARTGRTPVY